MYKIVFYKRSNGYCPVTEYIESLNSKKDKISKNNCYKIMEYIKLLKNHGLTLGMPYIRKISGDIWELRPSKHRILFFVYQNDTFVLLHCFRKSTQKMPNKEKQQAQREIIAYMKGEIINGK